MVSTLTWCWTVVLSTLMSAGLVSPGGPTPAHVPELGVQWHATWGSETEASRAEELDLMQRHGVGWVRIDVGWAMVQPEAGGYDTDWAVPFVEAQIDAARAHGLKVLVTFWRTPGWANGNQGPEVPPDDPTTYAEALGHFVGLWKDKVEAWEVWNEPNSPEFFAGADAARYTSLLTAAYDAAHAADPAVNIVFGGTMHVDTEWISQAYDAGAAGSFDTMAVHPYSGRGDAAPELPDTGDPAALMHVDALVSLMRTEGDATVPIWFTELGWSTHENSASTPGWARGVTEAVQADYLVRAVALTASRWPQVDVMIWYNSRDKATGDPHQDGFGLMRRDFSPKPALETFGLIRQRPQG